MTVGVICAFLAVFARASAFFFTAPLLGDRTLPARVRAAAAATISLALVGSRPELSPVLLPVVLPAELMLGLMAGFAGRIVMAGAEAGGQMIGLSFGLGLAQTFDPSMGESALITRRIALTLAGLAFLATGGLEKSMLVIAAAPADAFTLGHALMTIIDRASDVLVVGVQFAAPAMIAGLVANLGVALASKASPAFNIFSVMIAAVLVVGAFTMLATAPAFIAQITQLGARVSESMAETLGL